MPHSISLITTIAAALGLAMVLGFVVARLKMPPLVGYLIAGIVIGAATPGFVADVDLARQLAEIGVMLLMFGGWASLFARRPLGGAQGCSTRRRRANVHLGSVGHRRGAFLGMDSGSRSGLWPRAFGRQHSGGTEDAGRRPRIAVH
jgi:hypothetical protein